MEPLDSKVKKEMFCYTTLELSLFKNEDKKGYYLAANEGFQLTSELEGMTFHSLNSFKSWVKFWASKPEKIIRGE